MRTEPSDKMVPATEETTQRGIQMEGDKDSKTHLDSLYEITEGLGGQQSSLFVPKSPLKKHHSADIDIS